MLLPRAYAIYVCPLFINARNKLLLFPGKPFQPSLNAFVSKAEGLPE
jgi:hypothetical protein